MVKNPPANAGATVWSLVQEDPTCHRATKHMSHNYGAHGLQPLKPMCPRACVQQQEKPPQWEAGAPQWSVAPHSPQLEKAHAATKTQHSQKQTNQSIKKTSKERHCRLKMESPVPSTVSVNQDLISNLIVVATSLRNVTFNRSIWNYLVNTREVICPIDSLLSPTERWPCLKQFTLC